MQQPHLGHYPTTHIGSSFACSSTEVLFRKCAQPVRANHVSCSAAFIKWSQWRRNGYTGIFNQWTSITMIITRLVSGAVKFGHFSDPFTQCFIHVHVTHLIGDAIKGWLAIGKFEQYSVALPYNGCDITLNLSCRQRTQSLVCSHMALVTDCVSQNTPYYQDYDDPERTLFTFIIFL